MRYLLAVSLLLLIGGCSSARLKKCAKSGDSTLFVCPDQVQGPYRMCVKPENLFTCEDPQ